MAENRDNDGKWLGSRRDSAAGRAVLAVTRGDHQGLMKAIEEGNEAVGTVQPVFGHPVTALTAAAQRGDSRATAALLEAGSDPNKRASGHMIASPFQWAIEAGSLACIRLLDDAGASEPAEEDWAAHAVAYRDWVAHPGTEVLVAALRAHGTSATPRALRLAVERGIAQAAGVLLDHGADPNAAEGDKGTPPIGLALSLPGYACDRDTIGPRMLRTLLEHGADPNVACGPPNMHQPPPLISALERGADWAVEPLLKAGADYAKALELIRRHGIRVRPHSPNAESLALGFQRLLKAAAASDSKAGTGAER